MSKTATPNGAPAQRGQFPQEEGHGETWFPIRS